MYLCDPDSYPYSVFLCVSFYLFIITQRSTEETQRATEFKTKNLNTMRQPRPLFILLVLILLFSGCKNSGKPVKSSVQDTLSVSATENLPEKLVLPPLEAVDLKVTEDAFGPTISLKGKPLDIKENTNAEQLIIKDKYLITNNQRKDSIFMIFELPEMKCVSAFGAKGIGPEEFGNPRIVETEEDSVLFYIYENFTEKVYRVTRKHFKPEYYLTLPKNRSFDDKQIIFTGSKTAYYSSADDKGKNVYYFNRDSLPQQKIFNHLAIKGIKGSWSTLIGDFGINVNEGRIAYAYKYFKRLKIVDIKTMIERNIIFEAKNLDKGLNDVQTLEPTNVTHYWGMSAGKKNFWMLYSGRTPVSVYNDNQHKKKYIYVEKFDWNGNPVKRYKLDDWGYFCVDEKNQTLYLASTASVYTLLKYDISDSIKPIN